MSNQTSSSNSQNDSSGIQTSRNILWERTKRPLVFVILCLLSVITLIWLYEIKTDYDKEKNALWSVVRKNDKNPSAKILETTELLDLINKNNPLDHNTDKRKKILEKAGGDIEFRDFKSETELKQTLIDSVKNQKKEEIKNLKSKDEIDRQRGEALKEVEERHKKQRNDEITFEELKTSAKLPEADSKLGYIYQAIKEEKLLTNGKAKKTELEQKIIEYYDGKNTLEKVDELYKPLSEMIYRTELPKKENLSSNASNKNNQSNSEVVNNQQSVNNQSTNTAKVSINFKQMFFDSNGALNMIYKFIEVTLTVVIVFALLYLILIPLKYIFFLSTSADTLRDHAKKVVERKENPIVPSGLTRALLTTIGTIGIGAAVVANTNFQSASPELPTNIYKPPAPPNYGNPQNTYFVDNDDPPPKEDREIGLLISKVKELIDVLGKKDDTDPPDIKAITDEITKLRNVIKNEDNNQDSSTLFGQMHELSSSLKDGDENAVTKINRLERNLYGKPTNARTNLFELIGQSSDTTSSNGSMFAKIKFVEEMIKKPTDIKKESLFEQVNEVKESVKNGKETVLTYAKNIGSPNTGQKNLFDELQKSSDVLGYNAFQAKRIGVTLPALTPASLFTIIDKVDDKIGEKQPATSNDPNTLFGRIGNANDSVANQTLFGLIRFNTVDYLNETNRHLARESGNFLTPFKHLLFGKQYLVNDLLIKEIELAKIGKDQTTQYGLETVKMKLTNMLTKKGNDYQNISISANSLEKKLDETAADTNKVRANEGYEKAKEHLFTKILPKYRIAIF